jgi:chromosome segregation ATPase
MTPEREPEILDEAAIEDDERSLERRGAIDVMQIPRLLGGALTDLRTIAEGMATLPKLLTALQGIGERVDSLDDEVKRMRAAVEAMGGDVTELQQSIARVEPHLEDVSRVAHPLRRLNQRTRRQPPS